MGSYLQILTVGDSITAGARARAGWPEYLEELLNRDSPFTWVVVNRSVSGWTVLQALRAVDTWLLDATDAMIATVCLGANDAKAGVRTPLDVFASVYKSLCRHLTIKRFRRLFLIEIPAPRVALGDPEYDLQCAGLVAQFNGIIRVLAGELCASVVELELGDQHFADAIHLCDSGQREIARRVAAAIRVM